MEKLNLPEYSFQLRDSNRPEIFDSLRRKFVALTPEEWVRQNFIQYLIQEKKFPSGLISVEKELVFNSMKRRTDIVVYDKNAKPLLIVECKASSVSISQLTFDQIARYNMVLKVKYLLVTNGISHYCCIMDYQQNSYSFLKEIPEYDLLLTS